MNTTKVSFLRRTKIYNAMKKLIFPLSLIVMIMVITSCKKDKDEPIIETPSFPDYSQLKVGNYWIYQQFDIDASGIATAKDVFDSCYIEKDTMINGNKYFKMVKPDPNLLIAKLYLRDSLHYVINSAGQLLFSSEDFSSIFSSEYYIIPGDTVCRITTRMDEQDVAVSTPAGIFITSDFKEIFDMFPGWEQAGNPRYKHARYAENIGVVMETLPFFASSPKYVERRLVRYHLN